MLISYKRSQTSVILRVKILDSSVSTGAGKTGLTNASAGLIISTIADTEATATAYTGAAILGITTLGTWQSPAGTNARFREVDATNHPGIYEIHLLDTRFAVSNAKSLIVSVLGASGAAQCDAVIPLVDFDPYTAVQAVNVTQYGGLNGTFSGGRPEVNSGDVQVFGFTTAARAEIQVEAEDALVVHRLDELMNADSDIDGAAPPTVGSVFFELLTKTAGSFTYDQATDSLEALRDNAGTAGAGLTAIPWNAAWDAEVQSEVDDALVSKNLDKLILTTGTADSGSTTTMVDAARTEADNDYWKGCVIRFAGGTIDGECRIITDFNAATDTITFAPPATQAVSQNGYLILPGISVWDDTLAEHLLSGSTGAALNAAGSAGDPWNTALPGAYGAGTAGLILGSTILGRLPAALVGGRMDSSVGAMATDVLTDTALATSAVNEIRNAITGGAYPLNTAASGSVRVVDGTGTDEIDTSSGRVAITEAQLDQIVDEVWDELRSGHTIAGTFGEYVPSNVTRWQGETDVPTLLSAIQDHASPSANYLDAQLNQTSLDTISALFDIYHADVHFTRDQTNTRDEYEVRWFKNGIRQTSGITTPLLQVINRDGTDLVASVAMDQVGSTGLLTKNITSALERLTAGQAAEAFVTATINGGVRTFSKWIGRDST